MENKISHDLYLQIMSRLSSCAADAIHWVLTNLKHPLNMDVLISDFKDKAAEFYASLEKIITDQEREQRGSEIEKFSAQNVIPIIAPYIANFDYTIPCLSISKIAISDKKNTIADIGKAYFVFYRLFEIGMLHEKITSYSKSNLWNLAACESLKQDLADSMTKIVLTVLKNSTRPFDSPFYLNKIKQNSHYQKWQKLMLGLKHAATMEFSLLYMCIRELLSMYLIINKA
jgi:NAD-specific glutamate dehydrogenase